MCGTEENENNFGLIPVLHILCLDHHIFPKQSCFPENPLYARGARSASSEAWWAKNEFNKQNTEMNVYGKMMMTMDWFKS